MTSRVTENHPFVDRQIGQDVIYCTKGMAGQDLARSPGEVGPFRFHMGDRANLVNRPFVANVVLATCVPLGSGGAVVLSTTC